MSERIIALAKSAVPAPDGWDVDVGLTRTEAEQLLAVLEPVEAARGRSCQLRIPR